MGTIQWFSLAHIYIVQVASMISSSAVYTSIQPQCTQNLKVLKNITLSASSTACAAVCARNEECLGYLHEKFGGSSFCILQSRDEEPQAVNYQENPLSKMYFKVRNDNIEGNCMSSAETTIVIEESTTTATEETTTAIDETTTAMEETTTVTEETTTEIEETTTEIEETTTVIEETATVIEETTTMNEETTTINEEITTVNEATTINEETSTVTEEVTTLLESEDCLEPSVQIPLNGLGFASAKFWNFNKANRTVCKISKEEEFITYINSGFRTCPVQELKLDVDFPNFPNSENVMSVFEPKDSYLGIITDATRTLIYKTSDSIVTSVTVVQDIPAEVKGSFTATAIDTSVIFNPSINASAPKFICYPEKILNQWVDKNSKADVTPIDWTDISISDKNACETQITKWKQIQNEMMTTAETLTAISMSKDKKSTVLIGSSIVCWYTTK